MKYTNVFNLPAPLYDAIANDYTPTPNQYSVTTVLKGTKEVLLERRHDAEIIKDISENIWALFGTAVHSILERSQETESQIKENKIVVENVIEGFNLSGIFDLYDESTKRVTDYKTASVNKVLFNDWEDYRKQTLIYCWMLRKIGFEADNGEIVAFLKDWKKTEILTKEGYPKLQVYVKRFNFTDKDFEEIEAFIIDKFNNIAKYNDIADDDIPHCTDAERWYRGESFAIMKGANKKATKVCKTKEEAQDYIDKVLCGSKDYHIEFRKGENAKCKNYCACCEFCNFYKEEVKGGNE